MLLNSDSEDSQENDHFYFDSMIVDDMLTDIKIGAAPAAIQVEIVTGTAVSRQYTISRHFVFVYFECRVTPRPPPPMDCLLPS